MSEEQIKACPFCGETPVYEPRTQGHAPEYAWPHQIVHNCKVIGQQICVRAHLLEMPDTKESVFSIWNTRCIGQAGRKTAVAKTPGESTLASATGYAAIVQKWRDDAKNERARLKDKRFGKVRRAKWQAWASALESCANELGLELMRHNEKLSA